MFNLCLKGPVFGSSGYASAARSFVLALGQETDINLGLHPLQWVSGFDIFEPRQIYNQLKQWESNMLPHSKSTLLHWSVGSEFQGRGNYQKAIGHTVFETDRLIPSFVAGCNTMDALIVPSQFNKNSFQKSGVTTPIHIVHEGVDTERFTPFGERLECIPQRFTFLCVSQVSYRKGIDLVLKAYLELFAHHDDVQLVLRSFFKDGSAKDQQDVCSFVRLFREEEMRGLKKGHIYLLTNISRDLMPALYRSADVLLAPFRGEGWGLPITEALASELPVIATHWGGATEYLSPKIASLLNYKLAPIPADIPSIFMGGHLEQARENGHLMAEPDYEQLKYLMWDAYQNHLDYKTKAMAAREEMQNRFQWSHAAQQFTQILKKEI